MKRITIITGHYGSGKSEFSVNLALNKGIKYIVDLDIVNPYFRTRELAEKLEETGIKLISSPVSSSLGSDLPYIAKEAFTLLKSNDKVIYDLGGDPVGAIILRQFHEKVDMSEVNLLLCINVYREKTSSKEKIMEMLKGIENSGGIKVTGLINNSNLLRDTKIDDIVYGEKIIKEVAKELNLPIFYTGVYEKIYSLCNKLEGEIIPIKLFLRKEWL